jgi:hypothetical protein
LTKKKGKRRGMGKVLKSANRQIGGSNVLIDKRLKALLPGKRISYRGKIYYEKRRNRSDLKGGV